MTTWGLRKMFSIFSVALILAGVLSLPLRSSSGLGTGANEWDNQSFGWPLEVWSRRTHTYRTLSVSPGIRVVEEIHYPTQYSVRCARAGLLFGGTVAVSSIAFLSLGFRQARTTR